MKHIDKAGIIGVFFSHLCCLGLGAQVGLIAPVVSVFAINYRFVLFFIFISLVVSLLGMFFSYLEHKNILPFLISLVSSAMIVLFSFFMQARILFYIGMIGLISASVYNIVYTKKTKRQRR